MYGFCELSLINWGRMKNQDTAPTVVRTTPVRLMKLLER